MQTAQGVPPGEIIGSADQRVILHGVPWPHFEALLALLGDAAGPRMTYIEGELELMTPSRSHESIKTLLARMIELYALEAGIALNGYGSWTLRNAPKERAVEPDECYIVGDARLKDSPDLALEVVWTSGGLDKLEAYKVLGVTEVWQWRDQAMRMFTLRGEEYVEIARSAVLPDLDTGLLARLAYYEDQNAAVLEFRDSLKRA